MRGLAEFAQEETTRLNKLSETIILMNSKDARPMSAPTTRATYANDKQRGTRKRIGKKNTCALKSDYELNKNNGKLRLREINV